MIETCPLGSVVDVSAGQPAPKPNEFAEVGVPFIRAGSLEHLLNGGTLADCEKIPQQAASRKRMRIYPKDTIVFAKSGMSATLGRVYRLAEPAHVVSHLAALVPTGMYDPAFLTHWLRSNPPSYLIKDSAYPSIRVGEIEGVAVPAVPLREQRRIAAILDKAEVIFRRREDMLNMAGKLLRSAFLEMFGDPTKNPHGYTQKTLGDVAGFVSGGTPSKKRADFWDGDFPWVSPKDMKVELISEAEDHVSNAAFAETSLKKIPSNTPLIVVRGMILAHTVPIALTQREVAINQDMKAVRFHSEIDPVFGFWCLKVLHERILTQVDTAAHGTKRLDLSRLQALPILIPPKKLQCEFVAITQKFGEMRTRLVDSLTEAKTASESLSQRAFRGEL